MHSVIVFLTMSVKWKNMNQFLEEQKHDPSCRETESHENINTCGYGYSDPCIMNFQGLKTS